MPETPAQTMPTPSGTAMVDADMAMCLATKEAAAASSDEPPAKKARTEEVAPSAGTAKPAKVENADLLPNHSRATDLVTVCVAQPSGNQMLFEISKEEPVKNLRLMIIKRLQMDTRQFRLQLVCGETEVADASCIRNLPRLQVTLVIQEKLVLIRELELELQGFPENHHFHGAAWGAGVVGPGGSIYFAPMEGVKVLRITAEGSIEQVGPKLSFFTTAKYTARGVAGKHGCIYFAPDNAGKVLRITAEGNAELIGPKLCGQYKYAAGGVAAQDGSIYFAPSGAGKVLRITAKGDVEQVGPNLPAARIAASPTEQTKYQAAGVAGKNVKLDVKNLPYSMGPEELKTLLKPYGTVKHAAVENGFGKATMATNEEAKEAVKALNGSMQGEKEITVILQTGSIYFAPSNAGKVLRITAESKVEPVGPELPGDFKYEAGGAAARDGSIYFAPREAGQVLRITTEGNIELIGPTLGGREKYCAGGVAAEDGCIYFAPCNAGKVLRITAEGEVELVGPDLRGKHKYSGGGVAGKDGCIYFASDDAEKVLLIKTF